MRDDFLKIKKAENDFIEEFTRENPEWVKSRRLEYLHQEIIKEIKNSSRWLKIILACEKDNKWFARYIQYEYLDPRIKRFKKLLAETKSWEVINHDDSVTDEDIEMANGMDCKEFLEIARTERDKAWAKCPFHDEKTPSLACYPAERGFYCFGCGTGGSTITLVMKLHNLNFIQAVKFILKK
tara:strand:+ start:1821 stop:2366 length:546 start_codon:yes stop_codon:yes gene_type:complete